MTICIHCGVEVNQGPGDYWSHVTHLNRCQSPTVPYGHEAHPELPCPSHCLGSRRAEWGEEPVIFQAAV